MSDGIVPAQKAEGATSVTPVDPRVCVYSVYHPDEVGSAGWAGRTYFHSGWNDRNAALDAARMIKGFVVRTPIIADFRVESGRLD